MQGGGPQGTRAVDTNARDVVERHLQATATIAAGTVDLVEQLGSVQLVYATLADKTAVVAELRSGRGPAVGSTARFAPTSGTRHVFDAKGLAITLHDAGQS